MKYDAGKETFCEVTLWWNMYYIQNQISPHFFYYPAELMLKKGFDVEVLTKLYPERNESKFEINNGIIVRRFQKSPAKFCPSLLKYMLKNDYPLIHLHTVGFLEDYVPWITSKIKNIPMVFTSHAHDILHGSLLHEKDGFNRSAWMIEKNLKILNSSSVFIAFTQFQENLYRDFGIKNIRVIPHGIDPTVFDVNVDHKVVEKYKLEEINILCVGNIGQRKGQHFLVESMPEILKKYPKTKLFLVGRVFEERQKKYLEMLKSKIEKMNIGKNVTFLNDVSKNELVQLYLLSDVFAFPTDREMFGIVFLEAMAAGLPIISTNRPYIREILQDGGAGILVKRKQKEFEDGIINLLDDASLRNRLSKNGKKAVGEKYHLDQVIEKHWELYKSLIEI